mmetsp:Transcript_16750/g.26591  ORF Transcript_16750/g.26591 Transcript_16750/m.26591 type:complete len:211 (+) Transcript_16750:462-1094(+)
MHAYCHVHMLRPVDFAPDIEGQRKKSNSLVRTPSQPFHEREVVRRRCVRRVLRTHSIMVQFHRDLIHTSSFFQLAKMFIDEGLIVYYRGGEHVTLTVVRNNKLMCSMSRIKSLHIHPLPIISIHPSIKNLDLLDDFLSRSRPPVCPLPTGCLWLRNPLDFGVYAFRTSLVNVPIPLLAPKLPSKHEERAKARDWDVSKSRGKLQRLKSSK